MEKRYQPRTPVRQGGRTRNPFAEVNRENFPSWDRVIGVREDKQRTLTNSNGSSSDLDHSEVSSSSCPTSTLDMSIGARAAMTEHLRHIALHGLDGQNSETSTLHSRSPQEEAWDHLLDVNNTSMVWEQLEPVFSVDQDGTEAVEVAADFSSDYVNNSDYFNSSKIWQLSTPEKNKELRRSVTTRRHHDHSVESDSTSGHSHGSGMMYLYNSAMCMHEASEHNSSFVSFGVPIDLSRISGSDISDGFRSSPDESRKQSIHDGYSCDQTPSRFSTYTRDASYSTPRRSPPRQFTTSEGSILTPSRRVPVGKAGLAEKESGSSCFDLGLSPIAARAGSIAVKLGRPPSRVDRPCTAFPDEDSLSPQGSVPTNGLVDKMQTLRMEEPSPISQSNLSGYDLRSFPVSENCILDMDSSGGKERSSRVSPKSPGLQPRDSPRPYNVKHSSSSSTSCVRRTSSSGSSSGIDRRHYRTVVPARVFMDDANDFPRQDDSFSVPSEGICTSSSDSGGSLLCLPSRSLLYSFDEAAVDCYEVPFNDF